MNKIEFEAVINLQAKKRYEYFIKKVVDSEEIWALYDDGWATTTDNAGRILIPFWPKKEFAKVCAIDSWENYKPEKIDLEEFINDWLPGMKKDGHIPSIFWNHKDSVVLEIDTLLNDLNSEFENY